MTFEKVGVQIQGIWNIFNTQIRTIKSSNELSYFSKCIALKLKIDILSYFGIT